jgi:hypothetical protein
LIVQPFEKSVGRANRTKSGHQYRRAIFNISDSSLRDCTRLSITLYSLVLVPFSALINQTRQKHRTGQTSHRHCVNAESATSSHLRKNAARRAAQELVAAAELHT